MFKVASFIGLNQETTQWMRVKFCLTSQNQRYYLHTKFRPILRWSCENFCWNNLEWPTGKVMMFGNHWQISTVVENAFCARPKNNWCLWTCQMSQCKPAEYSGHEAHAKSSIMCEYPVTLNKHTSYNASSTSHNAISQKFEMVGGYTEDLTEPQNCQNWG